MGEGRRLQWITDLSHPDTRSRARLAPGNCPPKECHYGFDKRFTNNMEVEEPSLDVIFLW